MKYFFDTEFHEDASGVELISIGIVADDGREFYAINNEYDPKRATEWLKQNVIANLIPKGLVVTPFLAPDEIGAAIRGFCYPASEEWAYGTTEFWGYYAAYDWYLLCRLMGGMLNTPKGWPYYAKDVIVLADHLRIPRAALPPDPQDEHNALADARWNKAAYDAIRAMFPVVSITV